jgi:hypothetical protein
MALKDEIDEVGAFLQFSIGKPRNVLPLVLIGSSFPKTDLHSLLNLLVTNMKNKAKQNI